MGRFSMRLHECSRQLSRWAFALPQHRLITNNTDATHTHSHRYIYYCYYRKSIIWNVKLPISIMSFCVAPTLFFLHFGSRCSAVNVFFPSQVIQPLLLAELFAHVIRRSWKRNSSQAVFANSSSEFTFHQSTKQAVDSTLAPPYYENVYVRLRRSPIFPSR